MVHVRGGGQGAVQPACRCSARPWREGNHLHHRQHSLAEDNCALDSLPLPPSSTHSPPHRRRASSTPGGWLRRARSGRRRTPTIGTARRRLPLVGAGKKPGQPACLPHHGPQANIHQRTQGRGEHAGARIGSGDRAPAPKKSKKGRRKRTAAEAEAAGAGAAGAAEEAGEAGGGAAAADGTET